MKHIILFLTLFSFYTQANDLDIAEKVFIENVDKIPSTVSRTINSDKRVLDLPVNEMMLAFERGEAGFYCGGMAIALSKIFNSYGLDSYIRDMSLTPSATHVVTILRYNGQEYVFDPTFGIMIKDPSTGSHIPVSQFDQIVDKESAIFELAVRKDYIFQDRAEMEFFHNSFSGIALKQSSNGFHYKSSKSGKVQAHRNNYNLRKYIYAVQPHLRNAGLSLEYEVYFEFFK